MVEDYIKRSDVLSLKHRLHNHSKDTIELYPVYVISPDAVEKIPSADVVEVRHGKWVIDEDGCLICSECGYADEINGISGEFMHSNYCASCGARMDGKK